MASIFHVRNVDVDIIQEDAKMFTPRPRNITNSEAVLILHSNFQGRESDIKQKLQVEKVYYYKELNDFKEVIAALTSKCPMFVALTEQTAVPEVYNLMKAVVHLNKMPS